MRVFVKDAIMRKKRHQFESSNGKGHKKSDLIRSLTEHTMSMGSSSSKSKISWFFLIKVFSDIFSESKVGVISDSYKISDSIPRICRNDTSKLAPSFHAHHVPRSETDGVRAGSAGRAR
jgi:hypothetical protein